MIELNVNDFCHGCDEFAPVVSRLYSENFTGDSRIDHVVRCEHDKRCCRIVKFLEKKLGVSR